MLEFDPDHSSETRAAFRWKQEIPARTFSGLGAIASFAMGALFLAMSADLFTPVPVPENALSWHRTLLFLGLAFAAGGGRLLSQRIERRWSLTRMVFDRERGVVELAEARKDVKLEGELSYGELRDTVVRAVSSGSKARSTRYHVTVRRPDGGQLPVASFVSRERASEMAHRISAGFDDASVQGETKLPRTAAFRATRTADGAVITWPLRGSRANPLFSALFRGFLGAGITALLMPLFAPAAWAALAATLVIAGRRLLSGLQQAYGEGRLEIHPDRVVGTMSGPLPGSGGQEIAPAEVAAVQVRHARRGYTSVMLLRGEELELAEKVEADPAARVTEADRFRSLGAVFSLEAGNLSLLELLELEDTVQTLLEEVTGVKAL